MGTRRMESARRMKTSRHFERPVFGRREIPEDLSGIVPRTLFGARIFDEAVHNCLGMVHVMVEGWILNTMPHK